MNTKKLSVFLALASTFALDTAYAQEPDDTSVADDSAIEQQRPDREQRRLRRKNMTDEQRAAARERWDSMSDQERQSAKDKIRERRSGRRGGDAK